MAKPFYSIEEVCKVLGKSQDDVKGLVRGGQLREFRDAGKVFFKAEDVDKLAGGAKGGSSPGEISLEPVEDELPSLGESPSSGTSFIGLQPVEDEPEPARKGGAKAPSKEDTAVTSAGIGVFDEDELEIDADPMAKTQITSATTGDQLSLEGTGSGSGLLDLTRESDDTSLGAELLDEIYPGEEETQQAAPKKRPAPQPAARAPEPEPEAELPPAEAPAPVMPTVVAGGDPAEGMFAGLMVGALLLLAVAGSVVAPVLQGFVPSYAQFLSNNFWYFLGGAVLLPLIALLIGWLIGRSAAPAPRKR